MKSRSICWIESTQKCADKICMKPGYHIYIIIYHASVFHNDMLVRRVFIITVSFSNTLIESHLKPGVPVVLVLKSDQAMSHSSTDRICHHKIRMYVVVFYSRLPHHGGCHFGWHFRMYYQDIRMNMHNHQNIRHPVVLEPSNIGRRFRCLYLGFLLSRGMFNHTRSLLIKVNPMWQPMYVRGLV